MPTSCQLSLVVATCLLPVAVSSAQPRKPAAGTAEDRFRTFRLEAKPTSEQLNKVNQMKNGAVNLDPPSAEDKNALQEVARNYVYPVTHSEFYFTPDGPELQTKSQDSPSVARIVNTFRSQLLLPLPPSPSTTQLGYIREFGAASTSAIDEVLKKGPASVIRVNALRLLVAVSETGAPAAFDYIITLLKQKDDPNCPMETIYYSLKAAEAALGAYEKDRPRWVSKESYFQLVSLVDDIVRTLPSAVTEKAYVPEKPPTTAALATDPKAKIDTKAPLLPEQVMVAQAYRLQAVRALARVKTDIVMNGTQDKERRPLYTLCRVAISDPTLSPIPSSKEIGEAVIGLGTMIPSEKVNPDTLGLVIAKGVSDFVLPKAESGRELKKDSIQLTHWKIYGNRLKSTFINWERDLKDPKVRLPKPGKDMLVDLSQKCVTAVFDPLTKQTESGAVTLNKSIVDDWYTSKLNAIKASGPLDLYVDKPDFKITGSARQ